MGEIPSRVRIPLSPPINAPVAQLDRVSGYEPEGRRFESFRARHFYCTKIDKFAQSMFQKPLIMFRLIYPVILIKDTQEFGYKYQRVSSLGATFFSH